MDYDVSVIIVGLLLGVFVLAFVEFASKAFITYMIDKYRTEAKRAIKRQKERRKEYHETNSV